MLTEAQMAALPGPLQGHFQQLEKDVVTKICNHIDDVGKLTASDIHRLDELQRIGYNMKDIQAQISDTVKKSEKEIFDIFSAASKAEYEDQKTLYDLTGNKWVPFEQNARLQELIHTISEATFGEFVNISKTTGFVASGAIKVGGGFVPLTEYYQKTIDYAILQARTGQGSIYSAMRSSVRAMAENGLSYVEYESGYTRRLDSSVRMNILGGLANLSRAQADMIGKEIGADGYEISWHSGFRPTHDFGGKQFSLKEYQKDILPLLEEANCYHRSFPIIMGLSTPAYSKKELDELNAKELLTHTFEGKKYNMYEATQKQRRYETAIRKQKDLITAFEASGDSEAAKLARIKLRQLNSSYKDFSEATGLSVKAKRTVGTGKIGTLTRQDIAKTPSTLGNYDARKEAYMKDSTGLISSYLSPDRIKAIESGLGRVIEEGNFRTRLPNEDVLKSILNDGRFKTQFETNTTRADEGVNIERRERMAQNLFGTDASQVDKKDWEFYGYLGSKDVEEDWDAFVHVYGNTVVEFKKENLFDRTTFTMGDSYGLANRDKVLASRMDDPSSLAIQKDSFIGSTKKSKTEKAINSAADGYIDLLNTSKNPHEAAYSVGGQYFELQYHGGVKVEDISSVTFEWGFNRVGSGPPSDEVVQMLKDKGIKVFGVEKEYGPVEGKLGFQPIYKTKEF